MSRSFLHANFILLIASLSSFSSALACSTLATSSSLLLTRSLCSARFDSSFSSSWRWRMTSTSIISCSLASRSRFHFCSCCTHILCASSLSAIASVPSTIQTTRCVAAIHKSMQQQTIPYFFLSQMCCFISTELLHIFPSAAHNNDIAMQIAISVQVLYLSDLLDT